MGQVKCPGVLFCVITNPGNLKEQGGLAATMMFMRQEEKDGQPGQKIPQVYVNVFPEDAEAKEYQLLGFAKYPVFQKGEVVLLDDRTGRELDGHQRKPSKWFIDYELYDSLDDAILRAFEVTKCEVGCAPPTPLTCKKKVTAKETQDDVQAKVEILKKMKPEEIEKIPGVKELRAALEGDPNAPKIIESGMNAVLEEKHQEQKREDTRKN